jgi:ribosomal protein S24E
VAKMAEILIRREVEFEIEFDEEKQNDDVFDLCEELTENLKVELELVEMNVVEGHLGLKMLVERACS